MRDLRMYYILDGRDVKAVDQKQAYDWLLEDKSRKIIAQEDAGAFHVSTVFMIHDHSFKDDGPPIVFETMVFARNDDGSLDMTGEFADHCSTYADAVEMHARTVAGVRAGTIPETYSP